jgi:hypothetical protein
METIKIKYLGSGISMESAIFFSGVFRRSDFIKYQLAYLNANSFMVTNKYVKEDEDGFDYDIYLTQKGLVWFKKPARHPKETAGIYS